VSPEELAEVIEAVVVVQRDNGNRTDREHARLKYLIDSWGLDRFREAVEEQLGRRLAPPRDLVWESEDDHLGWHESGDGTWFLGVHVPSGRIKDTDGARYRSGIRSVVEQVGTDVRLTARQDVLLTGIGADHRERVEGLLREAGIPLAEDVAPLERSALACPALPTCGLALGEAERILPDVLTAVSTALDAAGVGDVAPHIRMTGCPNGCARPYTAELGIVGRGKTSYDIHVGGDAAGTRMNEVFAENIPGTRSVRCSSPCSSTSVRPGNRVRAWATSPPGRACPRCARASATSPSSDRRGGARPRRRTRPARCRSTPRSTPSAWWWPASPCSWWAGAGWRPAR
jgi:sulfite reductase (ferredoxin)